jgi:hypothetical protein
MLSALIVTLAMVITGCADDSIHCVTYETRHTGCGGVGWSEWTTEDVRDKFTGSKTECGGGCCIEVQYQNAQVSSGGCS